MRVAHLTTTDISLRYLLGAQLRAVVDQGDEALGISAPGPFVPEVEAWGVRHIPLARSTRGMNPLADMRAALHLWRILRRERVDVLHTHNPKPGLYGRVVGRLAGVPVVVNTVHGLYATPDDPLARRLVVYGLEAIASRFSHAELVQNPEDLGTIGRYRIAPPGRARLLGNGVDLTRFDPAAVPAARRRAVRDALGLGDGDVLVGTVGRLVAEKGYVELFEAVRSLGDAVALVVVGPEDPEKADALDPVVVESAGAAGVRFVGLRDDMPDLYAAMDVFVLASHREGFPRAAMEAAAMALPIVATDIRGCRQVVDHGVNGLLVPVGDSPALAQAISELAADPDRRQRLGSAGRRIAEDRFDERRVVDVVMRTYAEQQARPAGRPGARALKRAIDVVGALGALVALSPLIAAVAAAVRVVLGRPVVFRQERPGQGGRPFTIYKFRTMREAKGADGRPLPDEARLTRLGRLLRSASLDELPELWNVLRGDMSLVGPRPLLMEYVDRYSPGQARRHAVRPGLTGWAQVNGRNDLSWEERFELDVWYVDHWSIRLDVRILARTLRAVAGRKGISSPGHETMPVFQGPGDRS